MKKAILVIALFAVPLTACDKEQESPPTEDVQKRFVELEPEPQAEPEPESSMQPGQPEPAAKSATASPPSPSVEPSSNSASAEAKNESAIGALSGGGGELADQDGVTASGKGRSIGKSAGSKGVGGLGLSGSGRGGGGKAGVGVVGRGSIGSGQGFSGGTRPGHAPMQNTESYKNHGVNEMTDTAKDHLSTFAIDVDTGSYTIARRKLESGEKPPASSVRVEEFVNYFRYDYPEPKSGPFAVHLEAAPSPFHPDLKRKLMRVGVQGKRVHGADRKPVHLTFLVDVSGSMSSRDKLGLAKKSLQVLTNNLQEGDTVAIATYAGRVAEILEPTGIEHRGRIMSALESLNSGGSTAMNSGLEIAYKLALQNYRKGHVNRVIVLSDGDANVGPSTHRDILKRIEHFVDEGVTLSTIGFGMGNYKDTMMEQLANKGNGNYYYIDSMDEARKVFGEQVNGTLQVIAKDVKIQVDFNKDAVAAYRLVGYENRDIADKDFRNDKVDAGEIGAGHTVTALYEVILKEESDAGRLATVRVRHKKPDEAKASEQAFALSRGELEDKLQDASDDFQFAAAVAGFAELLRDSKYARQLSFKLVEEIAEGASRNDQADRQEFIDLVRLAAQSG